MQNTGYLGGINASMAERHALRDRYITPRAARAVDWGTRDQCRCGETRKVKWCRRWYCVVCARFVRVLNQERPGAHQYREPAARPDAKL